MNINKYNEIYMGLFNVTEEELDDQFNFGVAPGWDSLAHMELVAQIEETFDILLDSDDIMHFGGYENGKKILAKYGIEF